MEINYPVIGIVIVAAIILIILIVRRNLKDKKTFEQEMYEAELKTEKHNDDEARI
ncbi:MAG: hypothetical protein ABIN95_06245 [Mucilaginibacter sp.]